MKAQHTPGPWVAIFPERRRFHEGSDITHYEVMSEKTRGQLIEEGSLHYKKADAKVNNVSVTGMTFWGDMSDEEAKANARLIAAAPDLLKQLQMCVTALEMAGVGDSMICNDARDAIAKAKKEQS